MKWASRALCTQRLASRPLQSPTWGFDGTNRRHFLPRVWVYNGLLQGLPGACPQCSTWVRRTQCYMQLVLGGCCVSRGGGAGREAGEGSPAPVPTPRDISPSWSPGQPSKETPAVGGCVLPSRSPVLSLSTSSHAQMDVGVCARALCGTCCRRLCAPGQMPGRAGVPGLVAPPVEGRRDRHLL